MGKLKKRLLDVRIHQGGEFLVGNVFLFLGGVIFSSNTFLAVSFVALGLFLDYRVFFQTLRDIEHTQGKVKTTRDNIANMKSDVFSINSDFQGLGEMLTVNTPLNTSSSLINNSTTQSLEDKVYDNEFRISQLEKEIETSPEDS